jgi:hypothetical protein
MATGSANPPLLPNVKEVHSMFDLLIIIILHVQFRRSAYTKEEDKLIYSLVRAEFRKTGGGGLKGMKLFKSIEDKVKLLSILSY